MDSTKKIGKLFSKCGQDVELQWPFESQYYKAFIQLMRYKNKMYLDSQYTKLGIMDESSFLLISPADYEINELGDLIIDGDELYSFVKTERIYFLGKPAYNWSILRRRRW